MSLFRTNYICLSLTPVAHAFLQHQFYIPPADTRTIPKYFLRHVGRFWTCTIMCLDGCAFCTKKLVMCQRTLYRTSRLCDCRFKQIRCAQDCRAGWNGRQRGGRVDAKRTAGLIRSDACAIAGSNKFDVRRMLGSGRIDANAAAGSA